MNQTFCSGFILFLFIYVGFGFFNYFLVGGGVLLDFCFVSFFVCISIFNFVGLLSIFVCLFVSLSFGGFFGLGFGQGVSYSGFFVFVFVFLFLWDLLILF